MAKPKIIARRLLRANRGTRTKPARSWRVIARDDFNGQINFATLNRFALQQGEWIPKDEHLQVVLGLKKIRAPRHTAAPKMIADMSEGELAAALANRKEMPPVDPRITKCFVKLGWLSPFKETA
jgi:hypothetical protein